MLNHDYLMKILTDQGLDPSSLSTLQTLRGEIETILRHRYGSTPRIYYAGSYGKNTMIKEAFDLDIVIYFPHTESASLADIYKSVRGTLENNKYIVKPRTVALRLPYDGGFHIDVVPGRAQDATFYYATLYKNGENSTMQTSLKKHIDTVQPVKGTTRLMKLWKVRKKLEWETFALEQTVVRALEGERKGNYETNLLNVFAFIRDKIENIRLLDPANSNNEIEISNNVRRGLKSAAIDAIVAQYWSDVL
jgi:hypothetical protein